MSTREQIDVILDNCTEQDLDALLRVAQALESKSISPKGVALLLMKWNVGKKKHANT